jgi:hypothetical protein
MLAPECPDTEVRERAWQARTNFGIDKDTSSFMILVCFMDLKFAAVHAPETGELHIQHTS